ncbi:MAG: hypothetical protein ACRDP6_27580 [Actinoallomurus sp.]
MGIRGGRFLLAVLGGDLAGGRCISRITGIWAGTADTFLVADH